MKARIIKVWRQTYRMDVILLDERGSKIQGVIKNHLIKDFEETVKEDAVVLIKKFGVAEQNDKHRVINLNHKVSFFKCTEVLPVTGFTGHPFAFPFIPFPDITQNNVPTGTLTVDVIGKLNWNGNVELFKKNGKETKRLKMKLEDLDGNILNCTFWASYADQVQAFAAANQDNFELKVVIIQHGRIKEWEGQITVQTDMFATRLFLDEDLPEANDFRRSMILKQGQTTSISVLSSQTSYPLRDEFVLNTPKKHIDEIMGINEATTCVVVGTLTVVEENHGWFYKAHRACNKKVLTKSEFLEQSKYYPDNFIDAPFDSMWCLKCNELADSLVPKFKLQVRVQDSSGSVSFIIFDKDVVKILGLTASDIRDRQVNDHDMESFPHELSVLHNKVLAFKISITQYNIDHPNYHVYTVAKICDDPEVIEELEIDVQEEEVTPEKLNLDAMSVDQDSQAGVDSKECASVTGSSFAVDLDKDSESSPAVKRVVPFDLEEKLLDDSSTSRSVKKKLKN